MVYYALGERKFAEAIEEAKKKRNEGDYVGEIEFLNKAKQSIDSLPLPQNIQEKIEYFKLKCNEYEKLLGFYNNISSIGGLKESIIHLVKAVGLETPNANLIESVNDLENLVTNCTSHLESLMKV